MAKRIDNPDGTITIKNLVVHRFKSKDVMELKKKSFFVVRNFQTKLDFIIGEAINIRIDEMRLLVDINFFHLYNNKKNGITVNSLMKGYPAIAIKEKERDISELKFLSINRNKNTSNAILPVFQQLV